MPRLNNSFQFAPFSVQQKKLLTWWMPESPYRDYDLILAEGSVRSGKTLGMITSFVTWSQSGFQDEAFILAGRSVGALERNVLRPLFQVLGAMNIPYQYSRGDDRHVKIGSNTYYCFGANNERSQDIVQGLTAAGFYGDEAVVMPESFIRQAQARCSVDGAKIWLNCNPGGPFHWIKREYMDGGSRTRALVLHFTMDDNLALSESVKDRYQRMYSGLWFKRYILGLWVLAEGVIYDMFDEAQHVAPCPANLPRSIVAVDYGTANPTTFGLYRFGPCSPVHLAREYWFDSREAGRQKTDAEYASDFVAWLGSDTPEAIYIDPSAASFALELANRGLPVLDAKNDVLDGIRFTGSMIQDGCFLVDPSCEHTRKEFAAYSWDSKAQEKGEDRPLKTNDHAMDRTRYALFSHFWTGEQPGIW